ncbi:biopolymer transporter ExbD [Sodalis sp. CWE]|uniref:biopolymer transporter ExbD n=1 Tax=Sodalis sp. CWE TaxID=2803816 RepID=UPI001C7D58E0|nr:biopolymer transporter ExbD [Sodalis sp. CWE]MBX4180944.1 biopolymer transporter ExbD [Sodalis sp. CWE]
MNRKYLCRGVKYEINVVPLLDVLLVLLLMLMATSPSIIQITDVSLPEEKVNSKIARNLYGPLIIIEVSKNGKSSLIIENYRQEKLLPKQIIAKVHTYLTTNPKTMFLIGGDKNAPYEEVVKVLHLLYQAGVKSVSLMTKPSNS